MNFPVELVADMPIWYNWIGNIGAIAIFVASICYTIVCDDIDRGVQNEILFSVGVVLVGILLAICWAACWGLIVITIPGVIVFCARRGYWSIKDHIFYRKYDR